MTDYTDADKSLPPNYDKEFVRTVQIPRNPNRLDSTLDTYTLDVRPLLYVTDKNIEFIITHLPAWYASIHQMAWKAGVFAKAWRNKAIKQAIDTKGCSRAEAKAEHIYENHDFVKWESQAQWLERMAKALSDITKPLIQTYSVNLRRLFGEGMAPYHNTNES